MKRIVPRALAALALVSLTLAVSPTYAQQPAASCCGTLRDPHSSRATPPASSMSQWFKAKYGRELPSAARSPKVSDVCCRCCR